jgi:hypothetical protein
MADVNTEQQLEIEALQAIFGDELRTVSNNVFILEIFPQQEKNQQVSILFQFELSANYPNSPPIIKLSNSRGTLLRPHLSSLLELIQNQAQRELGHAMIFELTEFLREKLDQFCNDLAMGSFLHLQNEVYFLIFSQMAPQLVATTLPLVCKSWKSIASDEYLWQSICYNLYPSADAPIKKTQDTWKHEYFHLSKAVYAQFLRRGFSLYTVHRRVGTADIWSDKLGWKKNLIRELNEKGYELTSEKVLEDFDNKQRTKTDQNFVPLWEDDEDPESTYEGFIKVANEEKPICIYKIYSAKSLARLVRLPYHVQVLDTFIKECPYVDEPFGAVAVAFSDKNNWEFPLKKALSISARGLHLRREGLQMRATRVLDKISFSVAPIFGGKKLIGLQYWMLYQLSFLEPLNEQTMARGTEYVKNLKELMKSKQTTFMLNFWVITHSPL